MGKLQQLKKGTSVKGPPRNPCDKLFGIGVVICVFLPTDPMDISSQNGPGEKVKSIAFGGS